MEGRGLIKIGTQKLSEETITVTIQDNGPGMSQDFMENHLFRPFQTTKKKGSGLGLFSSKLLIEQSGGQIQVNSKEGIGTKFIITLPVAISPCSSSEPLNPLSKEHEKNVQHQDN
jgi:signal transduction histidine kinase